MALSTSSRTEIGGYNPALNNGGAARTSTPAPSIDAATRGEYLTLTDPPQSGESVRAMQQALRERGFEVSDAPGVLGRSTSEAMIAFQRSMQAKDPAFKVDGLAGPQTLGALGLSETYTPPSGPTGPATGPMRAPTEDELRNGTGLRAGDLARRDDARMNAQRASQSGQPGPGGTTMVPVERTRMTGSQAADALSAAWTQRYGSPPSRETLAVLTAQWAHETGRGNSMMNYNFGGIKGTGPSGLSASYKTREGWGANEVQITDRFRAYRSAEEGAGDYLALLDRRYPEAIQSARNGDAEGFVRNLKRRGYFTGNEDAYVRSVRSMTAQALNQGFDAIGSRVA